jgi:hypothetical protein
MFEKETRPLHPDFEQYRPYLNYELAGSSFHLVYDDGTVYFLDFVDLETVLIGSPGGMPRIEHWDCYKGDEITYLVHIELKNEKPRLGLTFILDTENSLTTRIDTKNGFEPEYPRWSVNSSAFGAIKQSGRPLSTARHGFTRDLVGSKIEWRYFDSGGLIHIYKEKTIRLGFSEEYLNRIREIAVREGRPVPAEPKPDDPPPFLFDEPAYYIKIKKDLYLLCYSEANSTHVDPKTGGGDGVLLINTQKIMDGGRFFGLRDDGTPLNQMIGAFGKFYYNKLVQEDMPSDLNQRRFTAAGVELFGKDKF